MFVSSIVFYLATRKSSLLKTPTVWNNFASFLLPVLTYGVVATVTHTPIQWHYSLQVWGLLIFSAIFFSYLGSWMSFKSIEIAPNVGFSLTLSKSYVVFTTLASIWLFQAHLSWVAAAAILLIVVASAVISVDPTAKLNQRSNAQWLPLAIGAFLCWGCLSLSSKYLLNLGVGVMERLIFSMVIVSGLIGIEVVSGKYSWKTLDQKQKLYLLLIGLAGACFNYFMQVAFVTAPNIGYVNSINAASIAVVTLLSAWFFGDELTLRKFLGVVGVIGGLALLVLGA